MSHDSQSNKLIILQCLVGKQLDNMYWWSENVLGEGQKYFRVNQNFYVLM